MPSVTLIPTKYLRAYCAYKFVRVGETFRFFSIDEMHKNAVDEGEKVESAGMVIIQEDVFVYAERRSVSLGTATVDDSVRLAKVLGRSCLTPRCTSVE